MLVPTKFTALEDSTIFKMRSILSGRRDGETISEIFARTIRDFNGAPEFMVAMDILYVLGVIKVDQSTGVVSYAE